MPGVDQVRAAVVDASVAVKWVVDETHSDAAAVLLSRAITWLAPRLMLIEAAAALRRKVVARELNPVTATAALRTLADATREGTIQLADDEQLVTEALLLALDLEHKVPDCIYLALAEREGCSLATADRQLALLARSRKVPVLGVGAAARNDRT
jgi:predicted nucleic acid-binding protein